MKVTNAWKSRNKNLDRVEIKIRFGFITVFELSGDWSDGKWRLGLFNFFVSN